MAVLYRRDLGRFCGVLLLVVLSTAVGALKPWPLAWIMDSLLGGKALPPFLAGFFEKAPKSTALIALSGLLLLLYGLHGAFTAWQNYGSIQIGLGGLARMRQELFEKLARLSLRFYQGASQGDLIYRATWDTYAFQTLFQQGLFAFVTSCASLLVMSWVMWRIDPELTLISLGAIPLLLAAMLSFSKRMQARSSEAHNADSAVTSFAQQSIAAMPLIQSFNQETRQEERFSDKVKEALGLRGRQHLLEVLYWLVMALIFGAAAGALAWLGGRKALARQITVGELTVFFAYLAQFYEPLNQLSRVGVTLSDARAGARRVLEVLHAPEELKDPDDPQPLLGLPASLSLRDVRFAYTPGVPVLNGISLEIAEGESLALIGPSGAGKSTLLHLLPRFYDPDSGSVSFGGMDIRKVKVQDLRAHISLVMQEPILLAGTVRENIAFAKPGASIEEIESAARSAHAHDFITRLPKGYETNVGEGSARLSVGEKQRLSLARAFLKNAPILLLDEPTSALDSESEALVMRSLALLMGRRTTIMIAHRLVTLRAVKRIAVLQNGVITEHGRHDELIGRRDGYYSRVFSGELELGH